MLTYNTTVPATIGDMQVDCVIDHVTNFSSNVTEHPIEGGFVIADHVSRQAMKLSVTVVITPTPVSYFRIMGGSNPDRLSEASAYFEQLHLNGEPITIVLPDRICENMVMTSCPLPRNVQDGFCYRLALEFTHVTIVSQKTEEIPEQNASGDAVGKAGATGTDAGASSQVNIGTGLVVRDNKNYLALNTNQIDLRNLGQIQTGIELTASRCAYSVYRSLGGLV
ncbi:MAG: hypothetical protein IIZ94_10565 [Prevotella sp.]|nr:hypothetical protein [Prevotella sp.]